MMSAVELARAIERGPLTPERFRKAARHIPSRVFLAATLAAIRDPQARSVIAEPLTVLVEQQLR